MKLEVWLKIINGSIIEIYDNPDFNGKPFETKTIRDLQEILADYEIKGTKHIYNTLINYYTIDNTFENLFWAIKGNSNKILSDCECKDKYQITFPNKAKIIYD